MIDYYSIGQFNRTDTQVLRSKQRWTLTTGQFSADQQIYSDVTTDQKKKRSPRFTFLKISAIAHCTHMQSRASQRSTQALQKSIILPTFDRIYI